MKDEEGEYYTRLECMFVDAVAVGKVIREDRIVTGNLWNASEEVSE